MPENTGPRGVTDDSASPSSPTPPRVLVVDDEKNIRRTLELVLRGEGYEVVEAGGAEDALQILANPHAPADLALFDVKLPGVSGLEALEGVGKEEGTQQGTNNAVKGAA